MSGAVRDIRIANQTPTAFSVVWFSNESVVDGAIRLYTDQAATNEITAGFSVALDSAGVPGAHALGLVKVTVTGLSPDQTVFIQTITETTSDTTVEPPAGALISIRTQTSVARVSSTGQIITNDLIPIVVNNPDDGASPFPEPWSCWRSSTPLGSR